MCQWLIVIEVVKDGLGRTVGHRRHQKHQPVQNWSPDQFQRGALNGDIGMRLDGGDIRFAKVVVGRPQLNSR